MPETARPLREDAACESLRAEESLTIDATTQRTRAAPAFEGEPTRRTGDLATDTTRASPIAIAGSEA